MKGGTISDLNQAAAIPYRRLDDPGRRASGIAIDTRVSERARNISADAPKVLLAEADALCGKTHGYHGNVTGRHAAHEPGLCCGTSEG